MSGLELTVLIPALNEADSLPTVLRSVREAAARLTPSFELLVVDGGSDDGTAERAVEAGARVLRQSGGGFGRAVREGIDAARGRWILQMDGDGSHPASIFKALWERREGFDLLIASRFIPGGGARMPFLRYALSRLLNAVTRRFLDLSIRDSSSGLKLYRAEAVRALELDAVDFTVQQEMLARLLASGGRVTEVPFRYEPRLGGRSKADIPSLAVAYLKMLIRLKRIRGGLEPLRALAAVLALGLLTGLWGLGWGLPGPARLRAFPERLKPTPETARRFAEAWNKLYEDVRSSHREMRSEEPVTYVQGVVEIPPGWDFPPGNLLNSYRSLLLQSENPDEKKSFIILSQMRPWLLEFKPLYVQYGGAFIYPLGAFLKAASLAGLAALVPDVAHYVQHPADMGRLYLLGRVFILLFHLGSLWMLFDIGRRLRDWRAGFIAALLFALLPVVAHNSHLLKPYPFAAFWTLAAARRLLLAAGRGEKRDYLLCGAWAGVAFGANFTLAPLVLLPGLGWLGRPPRRRAEEAASALAGCGLAAGLCLLLNPYLLFSYKDFAWELEVYSAQTFAVGRLGGFPSAAAGALGLFAAACLAAGVLAAAFRGGPARLLAAVVAACGGLIFVRFWHADPTAGAFRLYHPILGLACALAADWLMGLPRALRWALLAAVVADSGLRSFVYLENMRRDSGAAATRSAAADWLESAAPEGASIGLLRYPEPAHTPFFRYDRYRLVVFDDPRRLERPPDYLVVSASARPAVADWARDEYEESAVFPSFSMAWARPVDGNFFANAGMHVYRRRLHKAVENHYHDTFPRK